MKQICRFFSVFCLLFLPFCQKAFAQNWFSQSPEWINYFTFGFAGSGYEYVEIEGDTLLGGYSATVFKRFRDMQWGSDHMDLRIARQTGDSIYAWNEPQNQYYLMYDFSMEAGDSLAVPIYWNPNSVFSYIVENTGIMLIDGQSLRFQLVRTTPPNSNNWKCNALIVEKIGMLTGECADLVNNFTYPDGHHFFLDEVNSGASDGPEWFLCRFENDQFEYKASGTNCDALTDTGEPDAEGNDLTLSPNPFGDATRLLNPAGAPVTALRFYDATGRLLKSVADPGTNTIPTFDLPAGVYFVEILNGTNARTFLRAVKR